MAALNGYVIVFRFLADEVSAQTRNLVTLIDNFLLYLLLSTNERSRGIVKIFVLYSTHTTLSYYVLSVKNNSPSAS